MCDRHHIVLDILERKKYICINEMIRVAYGLTPSRSCGGLGGGPFGPCWGALQAAVAAVKAVAAVGGPNWELQLPIRSSNIYISCHSSG